MSERIEKVQEALVDMFAALTKMPVMLLEKRSNDVVKIRTPRESEYFKAHCLRLRSYDNGRSCETDERKRALEAVLSGEKALHVCHAGMFNEEVPIKINGQVRAVLLYGQMQVDGRREEALQKHREAVQSLGLTDNQADELQQLLFEVPTYSTEELERLRDSFVRIQETLYAVLDSDDKRDRHLEKVIHELQTRIQAVVALAENFENEAERLTPNLLRKQAKEILYSAEALETVVQNIGEGQYVEEYEFTKVPLEPLLLESKRLYEPEAKRKGIEIVVRLEHVNGQPPELEVSPDHLKYVFNNLIHNAVKYSFKSGHDRHRFVRVLGHPTKDGYQITFENYGVGIKPEEILSRDIFKPRYQGKLTQGEYRTGAGMGLFIAEKAIEQHNGHIDVTSEKMGPGELMPEGQPHLNRFIVYLPNQQPRKN